MNRFAENTFGFSCNICYRLWFKQDLKTLNSENIDFVRTFHENLEDLKVCATCLASIKKKENPSVVSIPWLLIPSNSR